MLDFQLQFRKYSSFYISYGVKRNNGSIQITEAYNGI